jgi:broad specificity phosphatase PhoE
MTARLIMLSHASTAAMREPAFPRADEPLDESGKARAAALAGQLPDSDRRWVSPELRTRQTAEALRLEANVQPGLRDCDYGRWAGCSFAEVAEREPRAIDAWLHDPAAVPHGGESIVEFVGRVAAWLAEEKAHGGRSIIVTHPTIIRAAMVGAMEAPPQSFWRVDIRPLSLTRLSNSDGRWRVASSGCPL